MFACVHGFVGRYWQGSGWEVTFDRAGEGIDSDEVFLFSEAITNHLSLN